MNGIIRTNLSIWVVNERKNYSIVNRRRRKKKQSCGVPCCLCVRGERRESESGRTRRMKENRRGKSIGWMAKKEKPDKIKVSHFSAVVSGMKSRATEKSERICSFFTDFFMTFRRCALVAVDEVDKTFSPAAPPFRPLGRRLLCVTCYEHPSLSMLDYSNVGEQIRSRWQAPAKRGQ